MMISKSMWIPLVGMGLIWSAATAGESNPAIATPIPPVAPSAGEQKDEKKDEKKKDFPDFKEVVTEEFKPVLILTQKTEQENPKPFYALFYNAKTDQLLAEISSSQLDKNFMHSSTVSAGPGIAGWMWNDQVLKWQRRDKQILLIEPDVSNDGKEGTDVSDAVRRTYTDRIVKTLKILTLNNNNPVIDLGELFKQDFAGIGQVYGGMLDPALAKWTKIKCFEQNVVLTVESPYKGKPTPGFLGSAAYEGTLISVNYNLSAMPETGYKPRLADDRIGYFTTVRRDWAKDYKQKHLFNRYVNRWHLEKRDSSLEKSPVKAPIVFYIEKTVPVRFRNAVKEGILEWNKAFEKCGFQDAMQARQQTESEFADFDPEDVSKNFFRWTTTGVGIAVGPSRANPLTGQIYDADIVFDDGWIRGPMETHAVFGAKGLARVLGDRKLEAFLKAHPSFDFGLREDRLIPGYGDDVTRSRGLEPDLRLLPERYSRYMCDCGASVQHELALSHTFFAAQGYSEIPEKFLQQIVKEVAMHEVGHTLGLRHNFKASTWLPLEATLAKTTEQRAIGASVMDYNAFMFNQTKELQGDHVMTTIGPYDIWAIEYGYRPMSEPYKSEEELLKAITDRVAEAGLDYATDEDTGIFEPDPLVNRRDMGSDPLEYARYRIDLVQHLYGNMADWAVDSGESYSILRRRFDRMLFEISNSSIYAGRYVGGQYFHRDHKGDPNARSPFVLVPADKQREAVRLVSDKVLSGAVFNFPPELLTKLAPGRWGHWGSNDFDPWMEYHLHDRLDLVMRMALLPLFNPFTLTRLHDMEAMYPADQQPYTLAEHIRSLTGTVWSELDKPLTKKFTDRDSFIPSVRRGLQRAYTQQLAELVLGPAGQMVPADANALMRMTGEDLHAKIVKIIANDNIDDASRAHLLDVQRRLRKALDASNLQS